MPKEKINISKYGGSLVVKIPKYLRDKHSVKEGDEVEVDFKQVGENEETETG